MNMGTRGLTCVVSNGKIVVGQYGQWDHYPEGQGTTVLEFLHAMDDTIFLERLKDCTFISSDEVQAKWKECGADDSGMVSFDIADNFKIKYPQLSRDMGGDVLEHIYNYPKGVVLQDMSDFANESLMCEWAYVIDMDKGTFEVYEGFQEKQVPADNRFQSEGYAPYDGSDDTYYPVKLVQEWNLDDLPTEKEFLAAFTDEDIMSKNNINAALECIRIATDNDVISDRICNYIEANMDDFIEAYEE